MDLEENKLRKLILKLVLPITIISFLIFTKWWYTLPADAPQTMYFGFPFPYVGNAWHTSMAFQFFAVEFIADLFIYFLIVLLGVLLIDRYLLQIKACKALSILLWSLSAIILGLSILICSSENNLFYIKRPYDMEIIDTGYQFLWDHVNKSYL